MSVDTAAPVDRKLAEARERSRELRQATYPDTTQVALECDLVMKGGITSGVVYPLAACQLARTHRFRSIGGSSAGAIAACLVAAAEYGRDTGGFNRLAALPDDLGSNLSKLFTAGPRTRTAHAALMAWLDPAGTKGSKVRNVLRTLLRSQRRTFWTTAGIGLVVALAAAFLLAGVPDDGVAAVRFVVIALAFTLVGIVVAAARALIAEARSTLDGMAAQGFGVCVGSDGANAQQPTADHPGALTDWLATHIDQIAGVDHPLLVSDLTSRGIDLQVMTTNLTQSRPMCFPFSGSVFLFDPIELGAYFPPAVVEALQGDQEPATESGVPLLSVDQRPLYRLPPAEQLPVVLAARISLSFPGLMSAVPLYAIDFSRQDPADRTPVRCWFSDGGITSNFPIHFFDSPWPSRPTFALDLRGYHPDHPESDVYYSGATPRQPRVTSISSVPAFLSSILNTMQYWADDAQGTLPGYRDRVVEVHLHANEGGINLQMPEDVVTLLAEKGRKAAEELVAQFDFDQHRWTRYLTTMSRMQDNVQRMDKVYLPGQPKGMRDVINRSHTFAHYSRSAGWSQNAVTRTDTLLSFVANTKPDFVDDVPRPESIMRITPRF